MDLLLAVIRKMVNVHCVRMDTTDQDVTIFAVSNCLNNIGENAMCENGLEAAKAAWTVTTEMTAEKIVHQTVRLCVLKTPVTVTTVYLVTMETSVNTHVQESVEQPQVVLTVYVINTTVNAYTVRQDSTGRLVTRLATIAVFRLVRYQGNVTR